MHWTFEVKEGLHQRRHPLTTGFFRGDWINQKKKSSVIGKLLLKRKLVGIENFENAKSFKN